MAHSRALQRQPQPIAAVLFGGLAILSACTGPESVTVPRTDPAKVFARLIVPEPAVTLSLSPGGNTVQLHVKGEFADGSTVPSSVVYEALDSTIQVDSAGLVTAFFPTQDLAVVRIALTQSGHTRRDSVLIRVLETPPTVPMTRLLVSLPAGASPDIPVFLAPTDWSMGDPGQLQLQIAAMNDAGDVVPDDQILIAVRSSDSTVAIITPTGLVTARRPGRAIMSVSAFANGRLATDSLVLNVGWSQSIEVNMLGPHSLPPSIWRMNGEVIRIGVEGVVLFTNDWVEKVDLIFDDTTHMAPATRPFGGESGAGNILGLGTGNLDCRFGEIMGADFLECLRVKTQARRFTAPGRYRFSGTISDTSVPSAIHGVVVVCTYGTTVCEP